MRINNKMNFLPEEIITEILEYGTFPNLLKTMLLNHFWYDQSIKRLQNQPNCIKHLLSYETTTQGRLENALVLKNHQVKMIAYTIFRKRNGRVAHIFNTQYSISQLMKLNGGIEGFVDRLETAEILELKKVKREKEKKRLLNNAQIEIETCLTYLNINHLENKEIREYIKTSGKTSIRNVLESTIHLNWLHNFTNGLYCEEIELELDKHNLIYSDTLEKIIKNVKSYKNFQLPKSCLWFSSKYKTIKDAIDDAICMLFKIISLQDKKRIILVEKRHEALCERIRLFEHACKNTIIPKYEDFNRKIKMFLSIGYCCVLKHNDKWSWGDYFENKIKTKTNLSTVMKFVLYFEKIINNIECYSEQNNISFYATINIFRQNKVYQFQNK
jgi:hypothetical protein